MKENAFVKEIMRQLDERKNKLELVQFRGCSAYVGYEASTMTWTDDEIGCEHEIRIIPIVSYDTVVGFADVDNEVVYEYGKYTATTSKQFTQICNKRFQRYDRVLVDVSTADRFTKKDWGWRNR